MNLPPVYAFTMLGAVVVAGVFWWRLARRDGRLFALYLAALFGALIGAKLGWFLAEGWRDIGHPQFLIALATGKTILGGLLGGYLAVEWAKRVLGFEGMTGDWFAMIVPLGIALGRVGCIVQGCCGGVPWNGWCAVRDAHGVARWPSAEIELGFNLLAALVFFGMRRRHELPGQHFHLYLMAYGAFRFLHEFLRDTPRELVMFSGYQLLALACFAVGAIGFARRARQSRVGALSGA
ncbi:MAG: prolipoprotein diacylglyceryl transferase [Chthoniobacterales bacterium]